MKIRYLFVIKLLLIFLLFMFIRFIEINDYTNTICAFLTLAFSMILLYRTRKSIPLILVFAFVLYCNYSIIMGEYFIGGHLGIPIHEVKNSYYYGINIRILLLFVAILSTFYNSSNIDHFNFKLVPKDNLFIFAIIVIVLILIFLFGIDRGPLTSYSVRITPIYEYSRVLFLFAYYFSGSSRIRKYIFFILVVLFILQDFYYGGRITSLQLILLIAVTLLSGKLTSKKLVKYGLWGIFINSLIVEYRKAYTLDSINIINLFKNLVNNYLVFDTPIYAYYASATHIAAAEIAGVDIKLNSFLEFIKAIIVGSKNISGDVTKFVRINYFLNFGGGLLPSHFYFWMGWLGVIVISIIITYIFNKLTYLKSDYQKIIFASIVCTAPRWYLYSPLVLFRGSLFITTVLYFIFCAIDTITSKALNRKKKIIENSLKVTKIVT